MDVDGKSVSGKDQPSTGTFGSAKRWSRRLGCVCVGSVHLSARTWRNRGVMTREHFPEDLTMELTLNETLEV